jgi:hypothetical protein
VIKGAANENGIEVDNTPFTMIEIYLRPIPIGTVMFITVSDQNVRAQFAISPSP